MNLLFRRFVVLIMLSVTAATLLIYVAFRWLFGDPLDDIARRQSSAQIFVLSQYVDQAPADEWLARLNKVREVSKVRLDIVPLSAARAALPARQQAALMRGEVVIDIAGKSFYRRVDLGGNAYIGSDDDAVHAVGLPIDVGLALRMELVRFVIVALALLIPIAFWSRAHWRALLHLSRVADQFGEGKLDARAHLPPGASVQPLALRINHMAARIEALLAAQRDLLHSVSHELRTPIARLEFALELLRDAPDETARARHIDGMENDLGELNALIAELLDMSKLRSHALTGNAPFALAEALDGCVAALLIPPSGPRLSRRYDAALGELHGDRRLLMRAVGNVLHNGLKYARAEVVLSARRQPGNVMEIIVEDDGPGIPEPERARVFEPFQRLDRSRDRATGGFGLGLAIARQVIALHHGGIGIETSELGGARFVIRIPPSG